MSKDKNIDRIEGCVERALERLTNALKKANGCEAWPVVGDADAAEENVTYSFARELEGEGWTPVFEFGRFGKGRKKRGRIDLVAIHDEKMLVLACEVKLLYEDDKKVDELTIDVRGLNAWCSPKNSRNVLTNQNSKFTTYCMVVASTWHKETWKKWDDLREAGHGRGPWNELRQCFKKLKPVLGSEKSKPWPNEKEQPFQYLVYALWKHRKTASKKSLVTNHIARSGG